MSMILEVIMSTTLRDNWSDPEEYGKELIHIGCLGDIKRIEGITLLCAKCRCLVGITEVRVKPRLL